MKQVLMIMLFVTVFLGACNAQAAEDTLVEAAKEPVAEAAEDTPAEVAEDTPTEAANREVVEQIAIAFNEGDFDALDAIVADDFVAHSPLSPDPIVGLDGLKGFFGLFKSAMPDAHHPEYTLIADGDLVAAWMPFEGTFENEMLGLPPTGETVYFWMSNVWEVQDGRATEWWINMDTLSYMIQVGAIPAN